MRFGTIIFALAIFISSCACDNEKSNAVNETATTAADIIIPFHGLWASEKYLITLKSTRSPRQSQDDGEFIRIPGSYNDRALRFVYHESGADLHIVKNNNSFYLKNDQDKNDSTEIVITENGNKMKIGNWIYIKTADSIGIPEDVLFKGEYKAGERSVIFHADGTITGSNNFKFYSIENDYTGPGMDDVDIIYLGNSVEEKLTYGFEFKSDTLLIYNIDCKETDKNGTCLDIQKGMLKWRLIRK